MRPQRMLVAASLSVLMAVLGIPPVPFSQFPGGELPKAHAQPVPFVRQAKFAGQAGAISTDQADPDVISLAWEQPTKPGSLLFAFVGMWDNHHGITGIHVEAQRSQWGPIQSMYGATANTARSLSWKIANAGSRSGEEKFHVWADAGSPGGKDVTVFLVELAGLGSMLDYPSEVGTLSGNTVSWINDPADARNAAHVMFLVSGSVQSNPTNGYTQAIGGSAGGIVGGVYISSFANVGADTGMSVSLANAANGSQANIRHVAYPRWANFVTGWEHGQYDSGTGNGYGDRDAGAGSSASTQTATRRSGNYALKMDQAANGLARWKHVLIDDLAGGSSGGVGGALTAASRFYVYFEELPTNDQTMFWFNTFSELVSVEKKIGLYFDTASSKLRPFYMQGTSATIENKGTAAGPTLSTGQWYRIDIRRRINDVLPPTYTLDWSVNGEPGAPYSFTLSETGFGQRDVAVHEIYFGNTVYWVSSTNNGQMGPRPATAYTYFIDDLVTIADPSNPRWPIGPSKHGVNLVTVDGFGTNASEADFEESDAGAINTASWHRVSFGHANNVKDLQQKTSNTSSYLEFTFEDLTATDGNFMPSVIAEPLSGSGFVMDIVVDGVVHPLIDNRDGNYYNVFAGLPWNKPGTSETWAAWDFDSIRIRWGFDDDTTDKNVLRTLMIEVDGLDESVPQEQTFGKVHAINPTGYFADPVNSFTGAFTASSTDVSLPGVGFPFAFTRSYTSADTTGGPLGIGWTHSYTPSLTVLSDGSVLLRGEDGQQVKYRLKPDGSYRAPAGGRSLLKAVAGGYELTRMDQTVYVFDALGRLTAMRDRNTNDIILAYGGDSLPDTITDTAGRSISFTHNGSGRLTGIALPDGRSVSYTYSSGRLASVTDLRGKTTTYAYNSSDLLTEITDPRGNRVIKNTYSGGRVVEQEDAMGEISTFSWNEATETATMTDARGKVWKDVYEGGLLTERIDPLGGTTSYVYDSDLNRTSVTDPRGKTWTMSHDARGNLLSRTAPAPLSYTESFTYDTTNNVTSATDGRGNATSFEYDAQGNLTKETAPGTTVTQLGRNTAGQLTSLTDPRGKVTTFDYDADGNLTEVASPLGHKTTMGYDSSGRMTSRVEPRGNASGATPADYRWTYAYDDANHPTTVTDPLGNATGFSYDDAGNLAARTDAKNRRTVFAYNAANELSQVTAPDTTTTSYAYDESGHLASRTDAKGHATTYRYDDAGRLLEVADPLGAQWTYAYDAGGNLTGVTTAAGNATPSSGDGEIAYSYDAAGRLTGIDYSDATPDVTFAYDANSNLIRMADGAGTETRAYDALDRLTEVTRSADSFFYVYDAGSNLTRRTYPDGTVVDLTYDDDSRLASVASGGATTTYAYDQAGNLTSTAFPNGTSETGIFDRAGRLTTVAHSGGVGASSSFAYTLDEVGNPTQVVTPEGTTTYTYDVLDRLTGVCFASPCSLPTDERIAYAYDVVGNRTSETHPTGTTTYAYNTGDQLTSAAGPLGTTTYTYDPNGNQTASGDRSFAYDLANRMTSTTRGGSTITYAYDGAGKRLSRTAGSDVTSYLWDPNHSLPELALERDGSGSLLRRYVRGNDLVSLATGGQTYHYQHDGLGSVVGLTSSSGTRPSSHRYEPYGAERASAGGLPIPVVAPTNPMRFTGELFDPDTGLYHLRAREYDPATGTFLSRDPLPQPMTEPGVSSYAYVNNRPTVLVDPSGMRGEMPVDEKEGCPGWGRLLTFGEWENIYCEGFLSMSPNHQALFGTITNVGSEAVLALGGPGVLGKVVSKVAKPLFGGKLLWKAGFHLDHLHFFPRLGKSLKHFQINWWLDGVKGSGRSIHIPLPFK
jgi:RHS repeat-associated protein